jgi:hypothetical protein
MTIISVMVIDVFAVYRPFMRYFRGERHKWFMRTVQPCSGDRILDVGGYPGFWTQHESFQAQIDCLNTHPVSTSEEDHRREIRSMVGDGCDLKFDENTYDVGFSNSVIEHVGSWERQKAFASELRRVAKSLWVQTPAYECPFEPHYLAPFIHYLPARLQKKLLRWFTLWGWLQRPTPKQIDEAVETTRLLKRREMSELFPDCEILVERLFGILPKSYVAVRRNPSH